MSNPKANPQTVLGPDCKITGEISLESDAQVHGQFSGTFRTTGMLELTETSIVSGVIIAAALRVGGRADADVIAEHGVEMLAGTELNGRLFTNRLSIVDGATFSGQVVVGPKAMEAAGELLRQVETDSERMRTNNNGGGSVRRRVPSSDVETVPSSLDKILQQHRTTRPRAESTSGNGA